MKSSGQRAEAPKCSSCRTKLPADARYCPKCGARTGARRAARLTSPKVLFPGLLVALAAAGLLVSPSAWAPEAPVGSLAALPGLETGGGSSLLPPASVTQTPSAAPPDLSAMSPREAADRLFNRVMAASEGGNRDEALQFAPMALDAYGMVPDRDADAEFHVGLVSLVTGDAAAVNTQIGTLRAAAPDHLLALYLAHELAVAQGDEAAAREALERFGAAYDAEIARGAPEYEAHANTLQRMRGMAGTGAAPVETAAAADPGQALFQSNCARCHGLGAVGTDSGPPLIHKYYEPGHHADEAFYRAVAQGVQSHHWNFGNMPPIDGVSREDVAKIVAYVRALQRDAGIN